MDCELEDSQQFSLKWNNHQSSVAEALNKWYWSGSMADVTLVAGNDSIKAHRLILASCSQYFADIFKDLNSEHATIVVIVGCDAHELRLLLRFMYTGEVTADRQTLPALLSLANTLRVSGLTDDNDNLPEFRAQQMETKEETGNNTTILNQYLESNPTNYFSNPFAQECKMEETPTLVTQLTQSDALERLSKLDQIVQNLYSNRQKPEAGARKIESTGGGGGVTCPICNKRLSNAYNLRVHAETHAGARHACAQCNHVSRSRDALRKHVAYRHQSKPRSST